MVSSLRGKLLVAYAWALAISMMGGCAANYTAKPFTIAQIENAVPSGAAPIPVVGRFEDLLAQSGRQAGDWTVRVGIADPGKEFGPFVIVYCLADWRGTEAAHLPDMPSADPMHQLGPLAVAVAWDDRVRAADKASLDSLTQSMLGTRFLFATTVPLASAGRCRIQLRSRQGAKWIAALDVKRPRPAIWQDFAGLSNEEAAVLDRSGATYPRIDGMMPLQYGGSKDSKLWTGPLPGLSPAARKPGIALSLEGQEFVVKSRPSQMLDWPDYCLIARWWVNGRPIMAQKSATRELREWSRLAGITDHARIIFGLPSDLGDVKAGDTISLQLMYCPDSFDYIPLTPSAGLFEEDRAKVMQFGGDSKFLVVPTPSNRLNFKLTPELLAYAKTHTAK